MIHNSNREHLRLPKEKQALILSCVLELKKTIEAYGEDGILAMMALSKIMADDFNRQGEKTTRQLDNQQ